MVLKSRNQRAVRSNQLTINNYQLTINNYQLPMPNPQSPMPNYQLLINGFEDFVKLEVFGEIFEGFC